MFARKVTVERVSEAGDHTPCPLRWIDNFAMRNFTNDAIFDDTLPVRDGLLEVGYLVPLDRLEAAIEAWFRRKGFVRPTERVLIQAAIEPLAGR